MTIRSHHPVTCAASSPFADLPCTCKLNDAVFGLIRDIRYGRSTDYHHTVYTAAEKQGLIVWAEGGYQLTDKAK